MKEEALDRTVWRTGFGRGNGPVVDRRSEWHRIVSSVGFHDACGKWIKEYGGLKERQLKGGDRKGRIFEEFRKVCPFVPFTGAL